MVLPHHPAHQKDMHQRTEDDYRNWGKVPQRYPERGDRENGGKGNQAAEEHNQRMPTSHGTNTSIGCLCPRLIGRDSPTIPQTV